MTSLQPLLPVAEAVQHSEFNITLTSCHQADNRPNSPVLPMGDDMEMGKGPQSASAIRRKWHAFATAITDKWHQFATAIIGIWHIVAVVIADDWVLEGASLICSVLLLVGLMTLFSIYDGKFTDRWSASVSFSTVIAIMSKAIKTTLMLPVTASISQMGWAHFHRSRPVLDFQKFDAASRGLLGTIRLLVALPSRWAILTALIAVIVLGIEAAAQQCLQYTAVSYLPKLDDIQYLDVYATDGALINFGMVNAGILAMTADLDMFTINVSIPPSTRLRPVLPETLIYRCPTTGCAQPSPYITLSLCSTYDDINEAPYHDRQLVY